MLNINSLIVAVLTSAATSIGKELATTTVRDGYAKLKSLLARRNSSLEVFVEAVEADPDSEPEQAVLEKQLDKASLDGDAEVVNALKTLAAAIEELKSQPAAAALFDFEKISIAGNLDLEDISAQGTVFKAAAADIAGDFRAKGISQKK